MQDLRAPLELAMAGDSRGFEVVVERFQDMAVGYAYSILSDWHLAEDMAQEAFIEAYSNLSRVYGPEAFPRWLKKILFKHCDRMLRRKRLSTFPLQAGLSVAAREGDPPSATVARELEGELRKAINALPPDARSVVTLFYISEYSQREISEFLGIPVSSVKSRLHRARMQLHERMIDMVGETLREHRPSRDKRFATRIERGLRDVYVDRTQASLIDGDLGRLSYRGYGIDGLAEFSTFEEVSYLLLYGALPNAAQLEKFDSDLRSSRLLPDKVLALVRDMKDSQPIDALRTVVSAMGGLDPDADDNSLEVNLRKGIRIGASTPTIVAAHTLMGMGEEAIAPNNDLGHTANFLYMLLGNVPDPHDARVLDKDLVLYAEHGANASSFAARIVASTGADLHSAITAAIAALKGPMHGGAAAGIMKMALEIGSAEGAQGYVTDLLEKGGRVAGFGHAVYRTADPRSVHLESEAKRLASRRGGPAWFSALVAVTTAMESFSKKGICPNVDIWSASVYHLLGIPVELFSSMFAVGRLPGWVAHVMEQYAAGVLLRPRLLYDGPVDLEYVPIKRRS